MERLGDRCMPGAVRRHLGDWVLRSDLGATGRANSTWAAGDPGMSIPDAVQEVIHWYRNVGLRPGIQVFDGASPSLSAELDRRRWKTVVGAEILVATVDGLKFHNLGNAGEERSTWLTTEPDPDFRGLVGDGNRMAEMTRSELRRSFIVMRDSRGRPLGGAMAVIDGDNLGVFAMKTVATARRTGVATQLLHDLAEHGASLGARSLWLQVRPDNFPAVQMYNQLGFTRVHGYHYRFAST